MIELKDVIHLYLGCRASWVDSREDENIVRGTGKLIAVHTYWVQIDESNTITECAPEETILHLRPLSDLKDKEIHEIASIILEKETHCYEIEWTKEKKFVCAYWKKEKSIHEGWDYVKMGMTIGDPFRIDHVWQYHNEKGCATSHEILHNSHELTLYLLRQRFDLFGLIESGQAIDATTINNQKR